MAKTSKIKEKDPVGKQVRKKVKEVRLKVVGMPYERSNVPIRTEKDKMLKGVWVNESAPEEEVKCKIRLAFGWKPSQRLKYLYASGRHLREATLEDIENADSWDCLTLKALMGAGCLYVAKISKLESKIDKYSSIFSSGTDSSEVCFSMFTSSYQFIVITVVHLLWMFLQEDDESVDLEKLKQLREIFTQHSPDLIKRLLKEKGFDKTLDSLVDDVKCRMRGEQSLLCTLVSID